MTDTVTGQTNPGTLGTEYNFLAFVVGQLLQKVQTNSLVKVISCTNAGGLTPVGRVTVQPLVFQASNLQTTPHGEIADLPYLRIQGGANAVIIDPEPGDIGLAAFCSRDIANVKANPQAAVAAGGATPGSFGMFDWADGLYLGGFLNGLPTQYVRFLEAGAGVEIVSPTKITLRAPTVEIDASTLFKVAAGTVDIEATGAATLAAGSTATVSAGTTATVSGATTNVTATGAATVAGATANVQATGAATISGAAIGLAGPVGQTGGGAATFSGSIDAPVVTSAGTTLHTHVHPSGSYTAGPTAVTGNSAPP